MTHQQLSTENQVQLLRAKTSIEDNKYHLHLSSEEAALRGVSVLEYDRFQEQLEALNGIVMTADENSDGGASYQASLQQLNLPWGSLDTNGQEERTETVFIPYGARFIRFNYISNSLVSAAVLCRVRALGGWVGSTGVTFGYYGSTDINLDASNTYVTISFRTWDSYGARCTWSAHAY